MGISDGPDGHVTRSHFAVVVVAMSRTIVL
jgi:hypothetical protein